MLLQQALDLFWADIAPLEPAFSSPRFYYLAALVGGRRFLLQGRLFLYPGQTPVPQNFSSRSVVAGSFQLADVALGWREFRDQLQRGSIDSPDGPLFFEGAVTRSEVTYETHHPVGIRAQARVSVVAVKSPSDAGPIFPQPKTDWDLRAADPPYESIAELANVFRLGPPVASGWLIEIVVAAGEVGAVFYGSKVAGTKAEPRAALDSRLDPKKAALGFRIFDKQDVVARFTVSGEKISWSSKGPVFNEGSVEIEVPEGGTIHCTLSYAGIALHYGWLSNEDISPNPRRAIFETFDGGLAVTSEMLSTEVGKGRPGRSIDFERGVAHLAWLLGFSVVHLGADQRLSDAPDVVALSPSGDVVVIECTMGLLKAENKLANLVARAAQVRKALDAAGNRSSKIYPVIVSARTREELKAELRTAAEHGVIVIDKDDLATALNQRSHLWPDPDALIAEAAAATDKLLNAEGPNETPS